MTAQPAVHGGQAQCSVQYTMQLLESLRQRGPGLSVVSPYIYIYIHTYIYTDRGLIDSTSVGLAQARPNNTA